MKKLLILSLMILSYCSTTQTKDPDGYFYVKNVKGINEIDAELNAKRKILELGLGEMVEGSSQTIDGESKEKIVNSSVEGYVIGYTQIGDARKKDGGIVEIDAKGKVNIKAIQDALKERIKDLGKPRFLMIIDEKLNGVSSKPGQTVTENAIVAKFVEFDFLDREQFMRIIAKEGGKPLGVYGDSTLESKALQAAAEMDAEILLIGVANTKNIGEIPGSEGLYSIQAAMRFKFVSVGSAQIIASDNSTGAYPHVSPDSGAIEAIKKAVDKSHVKITDQVISKWRQGGTIRVVFEGISYDDFIDQDVEQIMRNIRGVNNVSVKNSSNTNKLIELEVTALFSGNMLYRKMRERRGDFGFDFTQKEARPGNLFITVKPKN